ncbi:MAG: hypothetical protein NXY57DRAFT_887441 [Lentinula lateritia]|nr:hypothetical protein EV359DRAFT_48365 [Lentinula novae-zelandiae]KAJ3935626.1 MAG: hypothetical protein NXY57DRAFT_887441 [Lentinula lateritia]
MSTITITYTVHPPLESVSHDELPTSRTIEVPVNASQDGENSYYSVLHGALEKARNEIGADLTIWRDAVGKLEVSKETEKEKKEDDDGDEEEDEG